MRIDPIGVEDANFYAYKQIELASSGMMIRELMMNAIEATQKAKKDQRKIVFTQETHFGVPKLCIWNTGPGMDADEIFRMGNLGCKVNKEHALDKNFGEGAKVAVLRNNPLGMIYTSCKKGVVSRTWLAQLDDRYGRVIFENDSRTVPFNEAVLDVTDEYPEDQRAFDWTQVTLLGKHRDQNTVSDPYADGKSTSSWVAEELYHRFYRIDPTIEVRMEVGHRYADGRMPHAIFESIEVRRTRPCKTQKGTQKGVFTRSDVVISSDGVKYHFIHDEDYKGHRMSINRNCLQTDVTFGGIIHKGEIYSLLKGSEWTSHAFKYGINFGGKYIIVMVELPDNYPVVPETNRKNLQYLDRTTLTLEHFAEQVQQHRPQWIKDLVEEYSPDRSMVVDDVKKKLRELMNELLSKDAKLLAATADMSVSATEEGTAEIIILPTGEPSGVVTYENHQNTKKRTRANGSNTATDKSSKYPMFDIEILSKEEDVIEKDIMDKAGMFVRTGNGTVYVNMTYPVVQKTFDEIATYFPRFEGDELFTETAREIIGKAMIWRICSTVVRALAKHKNHPNWSREDIDRAMSPESLSMAADDCNTDFGPIKSKLSMRFATEKAAA